MNPAYQNGIGNGSVGPVTSPTGPSPTASPRPLRRTASRPAPAPEVVSLGRIPPQNLEAEMAVLGAMLLGEKAAVEKALEILTRDDFYRDAHAHLFAAMVGLNAKGEPVDVVTLRNDLTRQGILDQIGGVPYIVQLGDIEFTTANIEYYAKIVADKSKLRRVISECSLIAGAAYLEEDEADAVLSDAEARILSVRDGGVGHRHELIEFNAVLDLTLTRAEDQHHRKGNLVGVPTGFAQLDYQTAGLQDGELVIIAARPAMGKSSMMTQFATAGGKKGYSALVFSLEMNRVLLGQRFVCCEAKVDSLKIRNGSLTDEEWARLSDTTGRLWGYPIAIDDSSNVTVDHIRSVCRRRKASDAGLDVVYIDYVQLIAPSQVGRGGENTNEQLTTIIKGLKNIAREFNIPVVVLSQLSRSVERREDKRPMLSDLRDSGSLEAEADVVLFPYRPSYYARKKGDEPDAGFDDKPDPTLPEDAEFIIAKQRMGPTTSVPALFTPSYSRFDNPFALPEGIYS